jgi:DNA polymerase I-like protein with 3'-5' exonuclease and polymerase domains
MLAIDTECTGVDFRHGARPFFVTTCDDEGKKTHWEWDVDPVTRQPEIPPGDLAEIKVLFDQAKGWSKFSADVRERHALVFQNAKFDIHMLASILPGILDGFPWILVRDTLPAGHLLGSNLPHNLTDMASEYLGEDIQPYEDRLKKATQEARRVVQSARQRLKKGKGDEEDEQLAAFRIAGAGLPEMPSAKGECWRQDYWLPRALCAFFGHEPDHPWWTVLSAYALKDSETTMLLWLALRAEIDRRGLGKVFAAVPCRLPEIAHGMERRGITLNDGRRLSLTRRYVTEGEAAGGVCRRIAADRGYELVLPDGNVNRSLTEFMYGKRGLSLLPLKRSPKTGNPSLDRATLEEYEATLEAADQLEFIESLLGRRRRSTAATYLKGYGRFMLPLGCEDPGAVAEYLCSRVSDGDGWFRLFPSLNPTGTDTLRWSFKNPNSANISKQEKFNIRFVFGPAPGREWWSLDAKNLELRLPAYLCDEKEMIALFEKPDEPPYYGSNHLLNFHTVYPDIWEAALREVGFEKVGPHCKERYEASWYQWCKNGDFAKLYGCQERKGDATFHRKGAYRQIDDRFRRMAELNRRVVRGAEKKGYVETIPDRTVDPDHGYPLLVSRTERGVEPTKPLCYMIQGSAMWWTDKAMVRCSDRLTEWGREDGYDGNIAIQQHDELVFDLPKVGDPVAEMKGLAPGGSSNLNRVRILRSLMEMGGSTDFGIPTPVGMKYHPTHWGEGVTLS